MRCRQRIGDKIHHRPWGLSTGVLLAILLLSALPESLKAALELRGGMVEQGEYWRLLSGHFVHLSLNHALLNATGYAIVAFAFRRELTPLRELSSLLICAVGTGIAVWQFIPGLHSYVGLSGAVYGLLSYAIIIGFRSSQTISLACALYLLFRFWNDRANPSAADATAEFIGGAVVVGSHIYGALTGLMLGLMWAAADIVRDRFPALSYRLQPRRPEPDHSTTEAGDNS